MTNSPHVLIVSTIVDAATDEVVRRLAARGIPHKRLNTEDYPFSQSVVFRPGVGATENWLESGGRSLPFPSSVWYRRLRTPPKPDGMDEGIYTFCLQETRATLLGSIMGLPVRWMSHPASVWQAEYKPFQLSLAAKVGLSVPRSVVTNDPVTVRKAFNEFGGAMVVKPVRTGHVLNEGQEYALFTSRVLQEHLDELESARWSPAIYQTLVPKRFDVRVTIVGRRVFAAAIDSQSDPAAEIDWRKTSCPHLPHQPILVPEPVTAGLLRMMDSLGLSFGAIDMVQTPEGEYVFLEINPSGQWLWLDDMLGLGISHAVAEWLAQATPL
jgi:glutathione synthase/RimK-type ligase-like ATP-grasp enzyme